LGIIYKETYDWSEKFSGVVTVKNR